MNKSIITNLIALTLTLVGHFLAEPLLFAIGLFALSGAVTNWLAIHMLFEKVPGLYGSGVIPARFEDFKLGIRQLMMEQFFTKENIDRFLSHDSGDATQLDLSPVIDNVDLNPAFDGLIEVIEQSSFGGMLAMVGGSQVLQPLREPFIERMKTTINDITQTKEFNQNLRISLEGDSNLSQMQNKVSDIIEKRLNELTPELVKDIIQTMIRKHLGWLVVWGGVFGGAIGAIASFTNNF